MPPKRFAEEKLEALQDIVEHDTRASAQAALHSALKEKNNFFVAKAAGWAGEHLYYDLIPDLVNSYQRFLQNPLKSDKTCAAKIAIVRALYELNYNDVEFFREGLRYRQLEPVWGGHVDTAVDIRCSSAMGLAATNHYRVMIDLVELLYDEEYIARIGAIKAMEMVDPYQAELALRHKIFQGDQEPEVIAQCFSSLMQVAAEESLDFVAACLHDSNVSVCESAALALGESRLDDALDILIDESRNIILHNTFRRSLFRAIALQRNNRAFDYLISIIETEDDSAACDVVEVLAIYNYNKVLEEKVKKLVSNRKSQGITQTFQQFWKKS